LIVSPHDALSYAAWIDAQSPDATSAPFVLCRAHDPPNELTHKFADADNTGAVVVGGGGVVVGVVGVVGVVVVGVVVVGVVVVGVVVVVTSAVTSG
jgi:hypothetical protein